jgi:hypothetical protein
MKIRIKFGTYNLKFLILAQGIKDYVNYIFK